jgi:hypothetical protein
MSEVEATQIYILIRAFDSRMCGYMQIIHKFSFFIP